jgi:hypothetical protein
MSEQAARLAALHEAARHALGGLRALQRDRLLAPIDHVTTKIMSAAFAAEQAETLRILARARAVFASIEAASAPDPGHLAAVVGAVAVAQEGRAKKLVAQLVAQLVAAMQAGHSMEATRLAVEASFAVANPAAVAWAEAHAGELVKGIDATTRDRVQALITQAIQDGRPYSQTTADLKALYSGFSTYRAQLIATQESAVAYGQGAMNLGRWMQDGGLAMEKSWLTSGLDRICDGCESNEGEGWIPFDQDFGNFGEWTPGHVGCRCDVMQERVGASA